MPDITVVAAVYACADCLSELHERVRDALDAGGAEWEVVYVVDGSPDSSLSLLQAMAGKDPRIRILALARNGGQHRALLAGLAASRGRRVVLMDADLQDPPEAIPALLAALAGGAKVAFAGRQGRFQSVGRHATSRMFRALLQAIAGLPRNAGVFSALGDDAVRAVLACPFADPYLPGWIALQGLPFTLVPVVRQPRPRGGSSYTGIMRLGLGARAVWQALSWRSGLVRPSRPDRPEEVRS